MSSESLGAVPNLFDRLTRGSGRSGLRSSLYCTDGSEYRGGGWTEVVRDAENMTAGLRAAGARDGARVASVLTNGPATVRGLLGSWLAGGAVASLPVPARGATPEEYAQQTLAICRRLEPELLVLEERMLGLIPDEIRTVTEVRSWESFAGSGRVDPSPPGDDDVAFIQFSSGSTSEPKGCAITARAIASQLTLLSDWIQLRTGDDVTVSWLPLSHDMGMFGCLLTPWWNDTDLYLSSPERLMFSPTSWFRDAAEVGATLTAGNNTALHLAARTASRLEGMNKPIKLRFCILGAERIEWQTLQYVSERLGPYGLRWSAFKPAYGLAEATLAVSATPDDEVAQRLSVDAVALAGGEIVDVPADHPAATSLVGAGKPFQGVELLLDEADGVTDIALRSPALANGYLGDPERTARHFVDGALHTSDLGLIRDGVLYPVGRSDDLISVAGRKVYATEIEKSVDEVDGVRHGCTTLVSLHDGAVSRLVLLLEPRNESVDFGALARSAATVSMAKAGVAIDECVFLPRHSLPKTPSGKVQRNRCQQLLTSGSFESLATIRLAPQ